MDIHPDERHTSYVANVRGTEDECGPKPGALPPQDISYLCGALERLHKTTGVAAVAKTFAIEGIVGTMLGLAPSPISKGSNVVLIQGIPDGLGYTRFRVQEPSGRRSLGPEPTYDTFIEALFFAVIYMRQVIEALRTSRPREPAANDSLMPPTLSEAFENSVIGREGVHFAQEFANSLARGVTSQGFATFTEVHSSIVLVEIGIISTDRPILLGSLVVVSDHAGTSCTVRDFQNVAMPGPLHYPTLVEALVSTRRYFENLALALSRARTSSYIGGQVSIQAQSGV